VDFVVNLGSFVLVPRLGFISQPTGGNDDINLTFAPQFYLAVCAELGSGWTE